MTWVIENSKQTGLGFVTLLMIANHANAEGRKAFPSMKTLAKECRTSLRSVQRVILKLEKSGELSVDRSGGRVSHSYALPLMPNVDTETTLPKSQRRQRGHVNTVERGQYVSTLQRGHSGHVESQRGHLRSSNVDTTGRNVDIAVSTDPLEPSLEKKKTAHACLLDYHARRIGKIPDGAAQAGAVKWILDAGFSAEQAKGCYDFQLSEDWRRGNVSWLTVKTRIGSWVAAQHGHAAPKRTTEQQKAYEAEQRRKHGWPEFDDRRTA